MSYLKQVQALNKIICSSYKYVFSGIAKRSFVENCEEVIIKEKPGPCITKDITFEGQKPLEAPRTIWEDADCCNTCEEVLRHDVLCLKDSPHWTERKFQRTWWECPKRIKARRCCFYEKLDVPPPEIRKRGAKNPDAIWDRNFSDCLKIDMFQMPCPPCAKKTVCTRKIPSCCLKRCTLYPSYSECYQRCHRKPRPNECSCYGSASLCEVNSYIERLKLTEKDLRRKKA